MPKHTQNIFPLFLYVSNVVKRSVADCSRRYAVYTRMGRTAHYSKRCSKVRKVLGSILALTSKDAQF
jgi:hypothetical protein